MPIYKIVDLNISIDPIFEETRKRLTPYLSDSERADFDASATLEEIKATAAEQEVDPRYIYFAEDSVVLKKICVKVLEEYDGFFFHSSSLEYEGGAYVFTALSGTGKSTHTALWRKVFGEKVRMINDDKPIIRKKDGVFRVYGTPWMGKSNIGSNISAPVKAVYLLKRGESNRAEKISPALGFADLLEATLYPQSKNNAERLLALIDEMFKSVPLFRLTCNMNDDAPLAALNAVRDLQA